MNMAITNITVISHTIFYLLGIPGLQDHHIWISVPFFIPCITAFLGNSLLIFIIVTDHSLHEPMYIFLCMLDVVDICLSNITVTKALAIFFYNSGEISLNGCITQLFFIHVTFTGESGILLLIAFDRYFAICYPMRYTIVLTPSVIIKTSVAIFFRSVVTVSPIIFLLKKLAFCKNNLLSHTYCEHIGLAKYACDSIQVNIWYDLFVLLITVVLDLSSLLYPTVLHTIFHIPSKDAHHKALHTCGSYACVIFLFYIPGVFTILVQRLGKHIPPHVYILMANVCMLAPPMMNALIYGTRTKQIKNRVSHLFHRPR